MKGPRTIGFPRMMKEPGEKRVFLPEFMRFLTSHGAQVRIEEGYGSRLGFTFEEYHQADRAIRMVSHEEALQQEAVIVLRSPTLQEYEQLRPGTVLFSMLHYPTRSKRIEKLSALGIHAISMDSVANDNGGRLVENMHAVGWNGLETAFDVLEQTYPGLKRDKPFRVLVLGTGMVGKHAVVIGQFAASADHPVALAFPEGDYLKGLLVRKRG